MGNKCGKDSDYFTPLSMAFTAPIFTKLVITHHTFTDISCTRLDANMKKNVENTDTISVTLLRKVWIYCQIFTKIARVFYRISLPSFTQIGSKNGQHW